MDTLNWIMSGGGALICAERKCAVTWGGISRLTVPDNGAQNDYERTNKRLNFLQSILLSEGDALLFGQGPADTCFWRSASGQFYIISIIYCEEDADFDAIMQSAGDEAFGSPREILDFNFSSPDLMLFDSAYEGDASDLAWVEASIEPGRYTILTHVYNPDEQTELVVHRFVRKD